jgi:peptidoglycan L-alanyl-D-glutamate endopeptidase CwlK
MPKFSASSLQNLVTCDERLQRVFNKVVEGFDCTVICGFRGKEEQEAAVASGASKLHWPNGNHNKQPSTAVDVMPYPLDWSETPNNIEQITLFAGYVLGIAAGMGVKLRWGHDWDSDMKPDTKGLVDRPHFELV